MPEILNFCEFRYGWCSTWLLPATCAVTRPPVRILVLAAESSAGRWGEVLAVPEFEVFRDGRSGDGRGEIDVVLLDEGAPSAPERPLPGKLPPGAAVLAVVAADAAAGTRLGENAAAERLPADAVLPPDASPREVRTVCRLLGEIARLRRREHAGRRRRKRLAAAAATDPLSGLPNRRAWRRALGRRLAALRTAHQSGEREVPNGPQRRLAVAILDLDFFKRVNDAHGHPAGDAVLRAAGRALAGSLRRGDFVARLGGDEFGLLLWVPDEAAARSVVERVRAAVPRRLVEQGLPEVRASAGYAVATPEDAAAGPPSADRLTAAADAALGRAKATGRDRVVSCQDAVPPPR